MKRRKVNNLCRCTPKRGIIALHPDYAQSVYDTQLSRILNTGTPGVIANQAIRIGNMLFRAGRPLLALNLMKHALNHLLCVEDDLQRDYAHNHYWPSNPDYLQWYDPWSARVSEVDARRLAAHIDRLQDEISSHLGHTKRSTIRFRVHRYYERMFDDIYEV